MSLHLVVSSIMEKQAITVHTHYSALLLADFSWYLEKAAKHLNKSYKQKMGRWLSWVQWDGIVDADLHGGRRQITVYWLVDELLFCH